MIKKIRETLKELEGYVEGYEPSTEKYGAFIARAWYNCSEFDQYTLHEVYRKHITGGRYRSLFISGEILFMAEYTVMAWSDHHPVWVTEVTDVENQESEIGMLTTPLKDWDTKGLSPEEYLQGEIKKYRTVNMGKSACVYQSFSGHAGEFNLSVAVLRNKKEQKYCFLKYFHYPEWSTGNELRVDKVSDL